MCCPERKCVCKPQPDADNPDAPTPDELYQIVLVAVGQVAKFHKANMEDVFDFIRNHFEVTMTDCELYIAMEQQLYRAVTAGALCVSLGKYCIPDVDVPSDSSQCPPHCHTHPRCPPKCKNECTEPACTGCGGRANCPGR